MGMNNSSNIKYEILYQILILNHNHNHNKYFICKSNSQASTSVAKQSRLHYNVIIKF